MCVCVCVCMYILTLHKIISYNVPLTKNGLFNLHFLNFLFANYTSCFGICYCKNRRRRLIKPLMSCLRHNFMEHHFTIRSNLMIQYAINVDKM